MPPCAAAVVAALVAGEGVKDAGCAGSWLAAGGWMVREADGVGSDREGSAEVSTWQPQVVGVGLWLRVGSPGEKDWMLHPPVINTASQMSARRMGLMQRERDEANKSESASSLTVEG